MAGSSSRSSWERQQAAIRRELERQAREQARIAKEREKERLRLHLESQQKTADDMSAKVGGQIKVLDEILTSVLSHHPLSFSQLRVVPRVPAFEPGPLANPGTAPDWTAFAPVPPGALSRLFGGNARHDRQVAEAQHRFEAALSSYRGQEAEREKALAAAKADHQRQVRAAQADAAAQNSKLDAWKAAFSAGDAESVESFVRRVLDASRYPDGFPRQYQVAYRPENRDVIVEFEFPSRQAIPPVRGYRYIKARDSIDPLPRPENEIKQRYARLIACIALRALHEIFAATPGEVVEAVMFNGRVSTIDRATGKPARPHLLSVSADRANFTDLVLASVEPAACLRRLNALVSPNPFDMEAVEPFITFDLKRFRVMADHNATTGVLVTTSWFGRASEEFASRNRITLVNGAELKHLVKEHLNIDVIPGTSPPRRLRASDNAQTGRPGPTQDRQSRHACLRTRLAALAKIPLSPGVNSWEPDGKLLAPRRFWRGGITVTKIPTVLRDDQF